MLPSKGLSLPSLRSESETTFRSPSLLSASRPAFEVYFFEKESYLEGLWYFTADMLKHLFHTSLCSALICTMANQAHAIPCDTEQSATEDSDCVVLTRETQRGIWLSLPAADKLRKKSLTADEVEKQISAMLRIADARISQIAQLTAAHEQLNSALDLSASAQRLTEDQLLDTRDQLDEVLENADSWARSPALWFGVGVVTTLAGVIAVGVATK